MLNSSQLGLCRTHKGVLPGGKEIQDVVKRVLNGTEVLKQGMLEIGDSPEIKIEVIQVENHARRKAAEEEA